MSHLSLAQLRPLAAAPIAIAIALIWRVWPRPPPRFLLPVLGALTYTILFGLRVIAYATVFACAYFVSRGLARRPPTPVGRRSRWKASLVALGLSIAYFLWFRALPNPERNHLAPWVTFLTLDMWAALRLVTFLWESGAGEAEINWRSFLTWVFLPFTAGGPLLRYSEFRRSTEGGFTPGAVPLTALVGASSQIAAGTLLGLLASYLLSPQSIAPQLVGKFLVTFALAPWGFYLQTAGLFEVMRLSASICGYWMPSSFDRPFGRRNLSEFWATFNTTAMRVFRDYVFLNRWGLKRQNIYLNSFIVFILCGLWHGSNPYWLIWGLLQGLGFASFLWFRQWPSRPLIGARSAAVLTYIFICLCWYLPGKLHGR